LGYRDPRAPRLRIPPPLYYAGALTAAWGLGRLAPAPLPQAFPVAARTGTGFGLIALGAAFVLAALAHFRRERTTFHPYRTPDTLVVTGPYRFSRNPMYVGLSAVALGVALLLDSWWMVGAVFAACFAVDRWVIVPEERCIEVAFGGPYREFKRRVRRWL
jgi:protein-S-isoprenylcysteine O-methyltransferase Ste14